MDDHPDDDTAAEEVGGDTGPPVAAGFHTTDTGRTEAFSDAVFAIAITILALEMRTPDHAHGQLLAALAHQWPVYLGYLTSFAYIGVIWLNHHQAFTRIRIVDRGLHAANLALLFTTAALPFPTAVLSDALEEGLAGSDAASAIGLYALIAALMCASWVWIYVHLRRQPGILAEHARGDYVRHGVLRSGAGVVGYLVGGALGAVLTPVIALVVFLALPVFYFFTSEGFPRITPRGRA